MLPRRGSGQASWRESPVRPWIHVPGVSLDVPGIEDIGGPVEDGHQAKHGELVLKAILPPPADAQNAVSRYPA